LDKKHSTNNKLMEEIKELNRKATELIKGVNPIIDNLISEYVKKYGNESKVKEYISLIINGKHSEADVILKQLDNGK